ncbi:MAG: dTMP kinase [Deltaproteobacteria bacterium]|nr:dTMP kinase [Deltaproteobacteria bacterium]
MKSNLIISQIDQIPQGRFVVFEGPNGSGKSTVLNMIHKKFEGTVRFTREPGGTELGRLLRELLLAEHNCITPLAELFLILADRTEHVHYLKEEKLPIISDRYFYSTIAFQGAGRALGETFVETLCLKVVDNMLPDLVILFDCDARIGLERKKMKQNLDRIEQNDIQFHERVRESYLNIARRRPEPFVVIDTSHTEFDEVVRLAEEVVTRCFGFLH